MAMATGSEPEDRAAECYANKEDEGESKARITVFVPRLSKGTKVWITYPQNTEERLIVKANDVIYFNERLPDTIIRSKCKLGRLRHKNNETKIKIKLTKENKGLWEEKWCIEKQNKQ